MDRASTFFRPGGTLEPGAKSYIVRRADRELIEALEGGHYVFLLDSRQKGKSSLVARSIEKLREAGIRPVKLDLQRIGSNVTPEQWYAGLVVGVGQELGLQAELIDYWRDRQDVGPLARFIGAIQEVVLPQVREQLVIFIDEVDFVRALEFSSDEFFAAIRECYNRRASDPSFKRLTFCLVGVATPGQLIRNADISPFNIGRRVDLTDFSLDELKKYASVLDTDGRNGQELVGRIYYWLNGHPYLTQMLCNRLWDDSTIRTSSHVDALVRQTLLNPDARDRESNLADVERRVLQPDVPGADDDEARSQVLDLYRRVLRAGKVQVTEQNPIVSTLLLAGLCTVEAGTLSIRNRLYRALFDEKWRASNLPDAEVRRARAAATRAVLRVGAVASLVVCVVSAAAINVYQLYMDRAEKATELQKRTTELTRVSGEQARFLAELKEKSNELQKLSEDRAKSLVALRAKSQELSKTAQEREDALKALNAKTDDVLRANYRELMANLNAEASQQRWARVTDIVNRTKTNPYRNWEWGYAALTVDLLGGKRQFPKWSAIEAQPGGSLQVSTPSGVYDYGVDRPLLTFKSNSHLTPRYRRGNFRVQMIDSERGDAIFDASTMKMLIAPSIYAVVVDVDPKRRRYLLARDRTLETIELRTIDTGSLIVAYRGPDHMDDAKFLPDGTVLSAHTSATEGKGELRHWDSNGRTLDSAQTNQWYAHGLSVTEDGKKYAVWGYDNKVDICATRSNEKLCSLPDHPKKVLDLTFSSDGTEVATGCIDGIVRVFDVKTGRLLRSRWGHRFPTYKVAPLPKNQGWASIDSEGEFRTWTSATKRPVDEYRLLKWVVDDVDLDVSNTWLVASSIEGAIACQNLRTGEGWKRTIKGFPSGKAPKFLRIPGRESIVVALSDGSLESWSLNGLKTSGRNPGLSAAVEEFTLIENGKRLFVAAANRKFALVDTARLKSVATITPKLTRKPVDKNGVDLYPSFAYSDDTHHVATYLGETGEVQIYSTLDGSLVNRWKSSIPAFAMQYVLGGKKLVASLAPAWWARDGRTVVYDPNSGKALGVLSHPGRTVKAFQYSRSTSTLAALSGDRAEHERTVFLWDMRTLRPAGQIKPADDIWPPYFSPDGMRVITNSKTDGTTRLWDTSTSAEVLSIPFRGNSATGWAAKTRFSKDGRTLIQLSVSGIVRLYHSLPWD